MDKSKGMEGNQRSASFLSSSTVGVLTTVVDVSLTRSTTPYQYNDETVADEVDTNQRDLNSMDMLQLTLRPRPSVTWDESVINNEGMNRKSSKRCCIFHKKKDFGESSSESDEDSQGNNDNSSSSSSSSSDGGFSKSKIKPIQKQEKINKMARQKSGHHGTTRHVPNYQRFHA